MVTTVTATTATAVTATTVTATAVTASTVATFGAIAIVLLIVLLVTKELAMASDRPFAARLRKAVNLAVAPLLMTVLAITVAKVALIIR